MIFSFFKKRGGDYLNALKYFAYGFAWFTVGVTIGTMLKVEEGYTEGSSQTPVDSPLPDVIGFIHQEEEDEL